MASRTYLLLRIFQQAGLGTGVRVMACSTVPLTHRRMAVAGFIPACTFIHMTLATQLRFFVQKEPWMA